MYRAPLQSLFLCTLWLCTLWVIVMTGPASAQTPLNLRLPPSTFSFAAEKVAPLPTSQPSVAKKKDPPKRWLIYAGIAGAFAFGLALSLKSDGAKHHQRIHVTWPVRP